MPKKSKPTQRAKVKAHYNRYKKMRNGKLWKRFPLNPQHNVMLKRYYAPSYDERARREKNSRGLPVGCLRMKVMFYLEQLAINNMELPRTGLVFKALGFYPVHRKSFKWVFHRLRHEGQIAIEYEDSPSPFRKKRVTILRGPYVGASTKRTF